MTWTRACIHGTRGLQQASEAKVHHGLYCSAGLHGLRLVRMPRADLLLLMCAAWKRCGSDLPRRPGWQCVAGRTGDGGVGVAPSMDCSGMWKAWAQEFFISDDLRKFRRISPAPAAKHPPKCHSASSSSTHQGPDTLKQKQAICATDAPLMTSIAIGRARRCCCGPRLPGPEGH